MCSRLAVLTVVRQPRPMTGIGRDAGILRRSPRWSRRSSAPASTRASAEQMVVFLRSLDSGGFGITNDEPGLAVPRGSYDPAIVFLIQDGHIQRTPPNFSRYVGMPIDAFLGELRALPRGK